MMTTTNRLADRNWRKALLIREAAYTEASWAIKTGGVEAGRAYYTSHRDNTLALQGLALALLAWKLETEARKLAKAIRFDIDAACGAQAA